MTNLGRYPHSERVRDKFLQHARAHGRVVKVGVLVDLPLTHDLIAESIGSTRETVTLALRELMRRGLCRASIGATASPSRRKSCREESHGPA